MPSAKNKDGSDEEYLITRARQAQQFEPYAAKAWMITAKTLFPTNFNVQFEAYSMEKEAGHVQEAADCFTSLMVGSTIPKQLKPEIDAITSSLKDSESSFEAQIFQKMSPEVQHKILVSSAEQCEDTMEHCRLMLLLMKKFPQAVLTHGTKLVDTLLTADKQSPEAGYAKLLVQDTIPLLCGTQSQRQMLRLLIRAADYYNTELYETREDPADRWLRLFDVLELAGKQLNWDPSLLFYSNSLNRESYFQKLCPLINDENSRQVIHCGMIHLLQCLHELETVRGNQLLLEAFTDPSLPISKRRKGDIEITGVAASIFTVTANCWDLLHTTDVLTAEFNKLANQFQVKPWLGKFKEEIALYKGRFDDASPQNDEINLAASLTRASIAYCRRQYSLCLEHVTVALTQLPLNEGQLETNLVIGGNYRHLHFLPLTKAAIVHYCSKLILYSIKSVGHIYDLAAGNMIVLLQIDWPQESDLLARILEAVRQRRVFHYPLFKAFIINIDILEELMYLWSDQGGNVVLDILPNAQHLGQRRIGTRGADKGVKEDIKQAMRTQVARCNESIVNLITQFMTQERNSLLQSFL